MTPDRWLRIRFWCLSMGASTCVAILSIYAPAVVAPIAIISAGSATGRWVLRREELRRLAP